MVNVKHWILEAFFRTELFELKNDYSTKLKHMADAYKENAQNMKVVSAILKNDGYAIVGENDNKNHEHVYIVQSKYGDNIDFLLYSPISYRTMNNPRIMAKYFCNDGKPYISILDVITVDNNVGNGSILMTAFLKYCKQYTRATCVKGTLSDVDRDHFDRSEHFYKKHGFEVFFDEKRSIGEIEYLIK